MPEPKRTKSESLSLRLDPKTKFILEFVARIKGQSITTVVERAIKDASKDVGIGPEWDNRGNKLERKNWTTYWDPNDGVRTLKLISDKEYPTSYEEDELREFTLSHHEFFYSLGKEEPIRQYVDVIWERINEFLELWRQTKAKDYWAAGSAMAEALSAARVPPPDWPPPPEPQARTAQNDLDAEIPF